MSIQKILLDVGNVVIDADHAITHQMLTSWGVTPENAALFYKNNEYKEFTRGNITGQQFYEALVQKYLKHPLTYEQVVQAHNEHIYQANQEVVALLASIPKNKLAITTDTNEWQTDRERELVDLTRFSDNIFRSHELHMTKSDPGLFPYLLAALNIKPEEALLVDDSREKIEAARLLGISTILFENPESLRKAIAEITPPSDLPKGLH